MWTSGYDSDEEIEDHRNYQTGLKEIRNKHPNYGLVCMATRQPNHHWPLQAMWPLHQDTDKIQFNTNWIQISANIHTSKKKKKKSSKVLRFSSFQLGPKGFFREAKEYSNTHSFPAYLLKTMFTQMLSWSLEEIKNLLKFSTWSTKLNKHKEICLHRNISLTPCIHLVCSKLYGHSKIPPVSFHLFSLSLQKSWHKGPSPAMEGGKCSQH